MSHSHSHDSKECHEIFAQLSEYVDGELDPDLCERLETHMDDCPPCQAFLESLRRTVKLTRELRTQELPDELKQELVENYRKMLESGGI